MATYTTNYNLKKPALADKIRIADFNGNSDTIDGAMHDNAVLGAQLKSAIGIVENTNTATHNISEGNFVIWKGVLKVASSAISTGATLSDSNLSSVPNGGMNALNSKIAETYDDSVTGITAVEVLDVITIWLSNGLSMSADGKTLNQVVPAGFRPRFDAPFYTKIYDGSNYVDCILTFYTNGNITMATLFNGAISGIQPNYMATKTFTYMRNPNA